MDIKPSNCSEIKGELIGALERIYVNIKCSTDSEGPSTECNIENIGQATSQKCYYLSTLNCRNTSLTVTNEPKNPVICWHEGQIPLGESVSSQTVDYGLNQNTFDIVYNPGSDSLKNAPANQVKLYESNWKSFTNLTNECTVVSGKSSLTCTISEDKVPSTSIGITYTVKVINLCGFEVDPKISLIVKTTKNENEFENTENEMKNSKSSYYKISIFY